MPRGDEPAAELAFVAAVRLFQEDADWDEIGPALRQARDDVEELTLLAVERARARHRSWVSIGQELGVTRQAAQQRYGSRVA